VLERACMPAVQVIVLSSMDFLQRIKDDVRNLGVYLTVENMRGMLQLSIQLC
jgi:hypothetical protein